VQPGQDRGVQAGLHIGECELDAGGMRGPAVEVSRHLSDVAIPGEVLVSRTVVDLVAGSGLSFEPRGSRSLGRDGSTFDLFAART